MTQRPQEPTEVPSDGPASPGRSVRVPGLVSAGAAVVGAGPAGAGGQGALAARSSTRAAPTRAAAGGTAPPQWLHVSPSPNSR